MEIHGCVGCRCRWTADRCSADDEKVKLDKGGRGCVEGLGRLCGSWGADEFIKRTAAK